MAETSGPVDGLKNTEQLQAFLDLLVETGVEEFEGFGIHVRFTGSLFEKENRADSPAQMMEPEQRGEPRTMWEAPELWPGGKPPSFPSNR